MSYLRNVDLKFSRHGIQGPNTPRRVFWLVSAALTYLSPALGKEKVNLGDIGPLSTAQRNRLKLHFCPAFFIVESPQEYRFYNRRAEHVSTVLAEEAGSFDSFSLNFENGEPRWDLCGVAFRRGDHIRLYKADGSLEGVCDAPGEETEEEI